MDFCYNNWGSAPSPEVYRGIGTITKLLQKKEGGIKVPPLLDNLSNVPTDYPLPGCSSAEPGSVSSIDFLYTLFHSSSRNNFMCH